MSITITRESDGVRMFQWVADDKDELDHEIILRALEQVLGVTVSRWNAAVM